MMRCVPWARSCGQIRNRKNVKKTFSVCGARRRFFLIEVKNRQINTLGVLLYRVNVVGVSLKV